MLPSYGWDRWSSLETAAAPPQKHPGSSRGHPIRASKFATQYSTCLEYDEVESLPSRLTRTKALVFDLLLNLNFKFERLQQDGEQQRSFIT
jgi:hypothetical protein